MNTSRSQVTPLDLARRAPSIPDSASRYDWNTQTRQYERIAPLAYKMSTQTFDPKGQPKDRDKDYDK